MGQYDREADLAKQRQVYVAELLGLDRWEMETVRMPVDESALAIMGPLYRRGLPRIVVYCPIEPDNRTLLRSILHRTVTYDFVSIPLEAREGLTAELVLKCGTAAVKTWRWVNEDGTKIPLVA